MLGKNGQMPPFGVPKVTAIVPAASLSRQKRGKEQNSRHFVSHLGNLGRRLTWRSKNTVRQGAERQVSFPFVLCSDKEPVSKGGRMARKG
jgi:hypothetical protein